MVLSTLLQNRVDLSLLHQSCLILALFLSPQNLVVLSSFTSEPHGPLSIYLLQNLVVPPFTLEPSGLLLLPQNLVALLYYYRAAWSLLYFRAAWSLLSPQKPCGPPYSLKPRGLSFSLWLPGLGLNPSTHLPLQPHF